MKTIFYAFVLASLVCLSTGSVLADTINVNCNRGERLSEALMRASAGDTIQVNGRCEESVEIIKDGITLDGGGNAVIVGGRGHAISVVGAQRVTLQGLTLRNSLNGLSLSENASVILQEATLRDNFVTGIMVTGSSSLATRDVVVRDTELIGINVERSSEVAVTGSLVIDGSGVFGLNLAGASSVSFRQANVEVKNNTLGIQISIGSSAYLTDSDSLVNTSGNLTTGFTINSGSTLFLFEGAIISDNNQFNHGMSVSSNSNVDMDRAASITVRNNGIDGIRLENSHLNMFTMRDLEGPMLRAIGNRRHGVSAFLGSTVDLTFSSQITSKRNGDAGLLADNGSAVRVNNSDITENPRDVVLTFGARAEFNMNTIGSITCDATVLIRGDTGTVCPTP